MTESGFTTLLAEPTADHVMTVTMNRPEVMNALNTRMMEELRECFSRFYVDPADLRAIVLTGSGDRAFCAGGDLKERNGMSDATWRQQHATLEQMTLAIMACPVPVIAAINGHCFGGGLEIALTADFIYASNTARFGFPEGKLGIMPGACGTQNLTRACGQRRAKEIMMTGMPFTAVSAREWNIVNELFEPKDLLPAALRTANDICTTAPMSARQIKKSVNVATQTDLGTGYAFEIEAYNRLVPGQDRIEGVAAFNEKRKPVFRGE